MLLSLSLACSLARWWCEQFQNCWMRSDTPLSGPSWHSGNSDVGARTILNDPSAMNPESAARINQVLK
jgi:hypothetical protein